MTVKNAMRTIITIFRRIVFHVISRIITLQQIPTTFRPIFRQIVKNVTQQNPIGNQQSLRIMMLNSFRFIQENIIMNGIFVQTAILIQPTMPKTVASAVMIIIRPIWMRNTAMSRVTFTTVPPASSVTPQAVEKVVLIITPQIFHWLVRILPPNALAVTPPDMQEPQLIVMNVTPRVLMRQQTQATSKTALGPIAKPAIPPSLTGNRHYTQITTKTFHLQVGMGG